MTLDKELTESRYEILRQQHETLANQLDKAENDQITTAVQEKDYAMENSELQTKLDQSEEHLRQMEKCQIEAS